MLVFRTFKELRAFLKKQVDNGLKIGFVPTMGALHDGHISLISKSIEKCDITLCSIFVNPTQFNDSEDLDRYPRTEVRDIHLLEAVKCDVVFIPSVDEVYPPNYKTPHVELDTLESVMEGALRPGHFTGVMQVVGRFFEQILPDYAFFGEKDYQQLAVIKKMVSHRNFPINIVGCEIQREATGLAMSSRNIRLSNSGLKNAEFLIEQLNWAKKNYELLPNSEIEKRVKAAFLEQNPLELEYFEIADSNNLAPILNKDQPARAFIAAHIEGVRLIDNIDLN